MQPLQREGRIPHPREPVVPVALAARRLRQRRRQRRDHRPGRQVGQALEDQRRALQVIAPAVIGEVAGGEPGPPEPRGRVERGLGGLEAVGTVEAGRPREREEAALAGIEAAAGAGAAALDADVDVGVQTQRALAVAGIGDAVLGAGAAPGRGARAVAEDRLADLLEVDGAVHAAGRPDEHVMGVEVGRRPRVRRRLRRLAGPPATDDQGVADDHPAGRRHPRRLDDVRPRLVAAADRAAHVRGPEAPASGRAVEEGGEDARRVEARWAEPLDRAVGGDEGAGVAVGQERVVGDRRERRRRHPPLHERGRLGLLVGVHPAGPPRSRLDRTRIDQVLLVEVGAEVGHIAAGSMNRHEVSENLQPACHRARRRNDPPRGGSVPGEGFEPSCPLGQPGLSRPRIANSATPAAAPLRLSASVSDELIPDMGSIRRCRRRQGPVARRCTPIG